MRQEISFGEIKRFLFQGAAFGVGTMHTSHGDERHVCGMWGRSAKERSQFYSLGSYGALGSGPKSQRRGIHILLT